MEGTKKSPRHPLKMNIALRVLTSRFSSASTQQFKTLSLQLFILLLSQKLQLLITGLTEGIACLLSGCPGSQPGILIQSTSDS